MSTFDDDTLHRQAMLLREVLASIRDHHKEYAGIEDDERMIHEMATAAKYAVLLFDAWLAKNSAHPDGRCTVMELDDLLKLTEPAETEEQCPD